MTLVERCGRARRAATVAVLSVATATMAVPSAGAAVTHAFGPDHLGRFQNSNWGGYVASGGTYTTITGSWTQPQVTCNTTNDLFAPWVGIDGYGTQTVEQVGVQVDCSSGSPVTSPWYEMYPADPVYWSDTVNVGDSMTGTVTDEGGGTYTLTLTDNTAGWTETTNQSISGASDGSAEAVIESPTSSYPNFTVNFSNVTVDGQVFDAFSPQALDSGNYVPGPLSNGNFTISQSGSDVRTHASRGAVPSLTRGQIRY
jgi:hypothetical protein